MQRFFGNPESPLFGVYHRAHGSCLDDPRAVVLCPPIGQEYIRTHWNLRLLANQIARRGIHVLRFDYQGIGDSAGSVIDIDHIEVWQRNIVTAVEHLKQECDAKTVMLFGQRFGGSLAGKVAQERLDINSVVLWEPVLQGEKYLNGQRQLHRQMLELWVCKMTTTDDDQEEEILGTVYPRELCNAIEQAKLSLADIIQPQLIIEAAETNRAIDCFDTSLQKVIFDSRPVSWQDLQELETAYLRPKLNQMIVNTVDDMFNRLQKFDALRLNDQQLAVFEGTV
jgi:alpha/beta superfamily hydrolase